MAKPSSPTPKNNFLRRALSRKQKSKSTTPQKVPNEVLDSISATDTRSSYAKTTTADPDQSLLLSEPRGHPASESDSDDTNEMIPQTISVQRRRASSVSKSSSTTAADDSTDKELFKEESSVADETNSSDDIDEELTREELLEKLQTLYQTLSNVEAECAEERALRQKTESTVVSMAKSIKTKDRMVLQLAETVALFKRRLETERHVSAELKEQNQEKDQYHVQQLNQTVGLYASKCAQYQGTIGDLHKVHALAMNAASAELAHLEQEHKQVEAFASDRVKQSHTEVERLRAQLEISQAQADRLRDELSRLESSLPTIEEGDSEQSYSLGITKRHTIVAALLMGAVVTAGLTKRVR